MVSIREVKTIENDIKNSKEFSRLHELFSQLEKKWIEMYLEDPKSYDLVLPYAANSFSYTVTKLRDFSSKWKYNEINPETKELEDLKKLTKSLFDFSKGFDEKDFNFLGEFAKNFLSEAKEFLNSLERKVKEEIKLRDNPGPEDPGPEDPGPEDPGPEDPGPEDPGPEDSLEKNSDGSRLSYEIEDLKNRIKNLKKSLRETPNSMFEQHYRKEIQRLRSELLEKREKLSTEKGKFPIKLVAIGIGTGAVIILLLVIIYSKLSRKNQRY